MSNTVRRALAIALAGGSLLAVTAVATGFGSGSETLPRGTIKVGLGNNLTGFLAVHDKLISNGALVAVEQINRRGGIGGRVRIDLRLRDLKSDPTTSVTVANDLINSGVKVLILPCNTDFQVPMASVAQRKRTFTLSPCNADPTAPRKFPVYWPVGMGGNLQGAQLAAYARSRGYRRVYILNAPDFLYINLMTKYFTKAARSRGIRIVGEDTTRIPANDFSTQVTKLRTSRRRPDVIMTGVVAPFVDTFLRQLRAQGIRTPLIGTDGMDTGLHLRAGGRAAEGTAFTTFGYPSRGSATARFYRQYARKFRQRPDGSFAALGHEAIKVLEAAVLKARSTDPAKIQRVLAGGLRVRGALGTIRYSGGGQKNPVVPVAVVRVKNGTRVLVRRSVPKGVPTP